MVSIFPSRMFVEDTDSPLDGQESEGLGHCRVEFRDLFGFPVHLCHVIARWVSFFSLFMRLRASCVDYIRIPKIIIRTVNFKSWDLNFNQKS